MELLEQEYLYNVELRTPKDVFEQMRDLKDYSQEVVAVFHLDAKSKIISRKIVGIGTLTACIIHPRDTFRRAIARNANSIILCHVHPSGDPQPSEQDREVTRQLQEAGELLDIRLLDHVIVARDGFYSFSEDGLI